MLSREDSEAQLRFATLQRTPRVCWRVFIFQFLFLIYSPAGDRNESQPYQLPVLLLAIALKPPHGDDSSNVIHRQIPRNQ
jgi:hypothetical protein